MEKHEFKPYDPVLTRDYDDQIWTASLFSHYSGNKKYPYFCTNHFKYTQCIPFEGNESLLGTCRSLNDLDTFTFGQKVRVWYRDPSKTFNAIYIRKKKDNNECYRHIVVCENDQTDPSFTEWLHCEAYDW